MAFVESTDPYQEVLARQIEPSQFALLEDEHGNRHAQFEFSDVAPGQDVVASLTYHVGVKDLVYDLSYCQGRMIDGFLSPETYVKSNNEALQALADQLAQGQANPCQTLEAVYHYVGEHMTYDECHPQDHGAVWALENGTGDYTDVAYLLVALSCAAGIPLVYCRGHLFFGEQFGAW